MRIVIKPNIEEHIAEKHGITPNEVMEVMRATKRLNQRNGRGRHGASRFLIVGKTNGGDFLRVVFDIVTNPETNQQWIEIVTAYDAQPEEKFRYRKKFGR